MKAPPLRLRLPATEAGRTRAAERFERFAKERGLPRRVRSDVLVILDEILANIGRHAWKSPAGRRVEFSAAVQGGYLEMLFTDDGRAFDVLGRADPDTSAPLEGRPIGGLGILIVKKLTDEQHYERRRGRNRLILRKRLGRQALSAEGGGL
ncbi:MAG: ATP-binding protein [Acidobacteria bacterium]|nr:ATP-binding protein [Acidobacteriota bacterium]MCA1610169.1 ATP-binding protein [Acidobacteriota bacterium]MCA1617243.1 ATP-binding protein [Acidobacteriota bacterium]